MLRSIWLEKLVVIPTAKHPACFAATRPLIESSMIKHVVGSSESFFRVISNTSGEGLGALTRARVHHNLKEGFDIELLHKEVPISGRCRCRQGKSEVLM